MSTKILFVEDDRFQRTTISKLLMKLGFQVISAEDSQEALAVLRAKRGANIKLVLTDIGLPVVSGIELLQMLKSQFPELPVVILTASKDVDDAVNAMKYGAADYLIKTPDPQRLKVSINNAIKLGTLEKEVNYLKKKEKGSFQFEDVVGYDKGLADTINKARKAAKVDLPVMITGDTGTGKEVVAKAIHGESHRSNGPFVAVNCGAIPESLIESTLFGHEKGAFTGAISKLPGKFREAHKGTIFLDEIGELPVGSQAKLLRTIQEKTVQPIGSEGALDIDVRIICATNRNLYDCVAEKQFREDLLYRLNVIPIELPILDNRRQDIPDLVYHFIDRYVANEGGGYKDVSDEAIKYLSNQKWNGNVRQLENTIYRALAFAEEECLTVQDFLMLKNDLSRDNIPDLKKESSEHSVPLFDDNGNLHTIDFIEQKVIEFSLQHNENNITKTAHDIGMAKATLYRKIKSFKQGGNNVSV